MSSGFMKGVSIKQKYKLELGDSLNHEASPADIKSRKSVYNKVSSNLLEYYDPEDIDAGRFLNTYFIPGGKVHLSIMQDKPGWQEDFCRELKIQKYMVCRSCKKKHYEGCCANYDSDNRTIGLYVIGWYEENCNYISLVSPNNPTYQSSLTNPKDVHGFSHPISQSVKDGLQLKPSLFRSNTKPKIKYNINNSPEINYESWVAMGVETRKIFLEKTPLDRIDVFLRKVCPKLRIADLNSQKWIDLAQECYQMGRSSMVHDVEEVNKIEK